MIREKIKIQGAGLPWLLAGPTKFGFDPVQAGQKLLRFESGIYGGHRIYKVRLI